MARLGRVRGRVRVRGRGTVRVRVRVRVRFKVGVRAGAGVGVGVGVGVRVRVRVRVRARLTLAAQQCRGDTGTYREIQGDTGRCIGRALRSRLSSAVASAALAEPLVRVRG